METTASIWPESLPVVQVRVARPTAQLDRVVAFYRDVLGLPELYRSQGDGYEVVMLGLPDDRYHLEFTSLPGGGSGAAPTDENLLVFYFATAAQMQDVVRRFREHHHEPVHVDNPWWRDHGALAFADPDNWRVVLMPKPVPLVEPAG